MDTVRKSGYRLAIQPKFIEESLTAIQRSNQKKITYRKKHNFIAFGLMFILLIIYTNHSVKSVNNNDVSMINLTQDPGREIYPSISPNGRYLLYTWRKIGKQTDIYLKDLSHVDLPPKQLTFSDEMELKPIWSTKNNTIFYIQRAWNRSYCHVIRFNLVTLVQENIASCAAVIDGQIALSHDGKTLAYTGLGEDEDDFAIYFLDLTNKNSTPIRFSCGMDCDFIENDFAFSPNDKYLAISRSLGVQAENIFLIDIENKHTEQLTYKETDIRGLTWHPAGEKIVYASSKSGVRQGFVVNISDKKINSLNVEGFSYPSFIRNSVDVVYHHWVNNYYISEVSLIDKTTTTPFPLLQASFDMRSPHYSPQSNQLVFVANETGFNEIWTANLDGSNRTKITNLQTNLSYPRWSHDGSKIVFSGPEKLQLSNNIYIFDTKTQAIKTLNSPFKAHFKADWSHSDNAINAITINDHNASLYQFSLESETVNLLLSGPIKYAQQDKLQKIWFTKKRNDGLWVYDPQMHDGSPTQVLNAEQFNSRYNWTLSSDGIIFTVSQQKIFNPFPIFIENVRQFFVNDIYRRS